jgi:hypothetical protein
MFLFTEEIPVSEQEVQDWLDTIPNLSTTKWRREAYRKTYAVEEKIRAAKRLASNNPSNKTQSKAL